MQISEIGLNAREKLIDILSVGFSQRSPQQWSQFLNRIATAMTGKNLPETAVGQGPRIGWLLGSPESPDGILLGLPNPLSGLTDRNQPQGINMSSWFVKEEKRAQAIWMLRKISNLAGHTFTDLSPSAVVARMLPSLGYSPICQGITRVYTPQAVMAAKGGWQVVAADAAIAKQSDPQFVQALQDHRALGCLVLGLERNGRCLPLVVKTGQSWRRGLHAEVIYLPAPDAETPNPRRAIPALARALLGRGVLQLDIERPLDDRLNTPMLQRLVSDRPRFAKGPYPVGGISHLYSELAYA
ncbi:MAG: hypothetical protein AB8C46_24610 [Burkholderiaceae bacterium]